MQAQPFSTASSSSWYPPLYLPTFEELRNRTWWPINAMQQAVLVSMAELALLGGASGGGKTNLMAADAMQEYQNPWLRALVLRASLVEMQELSDQMQRMYEPLGARWKKPNKFARHAWCFPHGGTITPGYLRHEKDLAKYQGNPYSCLELDESGNHPEKLIRRLLGWLAPPVGHRLRARARFGSNPGGPGHGWQMAIFLRNRCPIHYPADLRDRSPLTTSVVPGKVYYGAHWPSDNGQVGFTTAFFPAFLADNPLYGLQKRTALMTQTAAIRSQLLDGCWCNAEGLYFPFLRPEHLVPIQKVPREWWWGHFISHDYGYGNSAAAAGMYAIGANGQVFKVRERIERKMSSKQFAMGICKNGFEATENPAQPKHSSWLAKLRDRDPEGPRVLFAVFDSANDQHTGTGESNFEQMQAVYTEYGIPCFLAAKDPMGNAQKVYSGLDEKMLVITSACPYTFGSLRSRTIDDRNAVKKVKGDPQDDIYDETAYGWNTWKTDSVKPERLKLQEELEQMRKDGVDETSIARYAWQREQELRTAETREGQGIPLGGRRIGRKITKR